MASRDRAAGRARRLLSALASSTPAFTPQATPPVSAGRGRRLLSALASSTPAFTPGDRGDEYTPVPPNAPDEATSKNAETPPGSPPDGDGLRSGLGILADALAEYSPHERLAARTWLSIPDLAHIRDLDHETARYTDRAHDHTRRLIRDLDHVLGVDLDRRTARLRDLDIALYPDRARDIARTLDHTRRLIRDLVRDLDAARDLDTARDTARYTDYALERAVARALDRGDDDAHDRLQAYLRDRARVRDLDRAFEGDLPLTRVRDLAHSLDRSLAKALDSALAADLSFIREYARDLVRALDRALDRVHARSAESTKLIEVVSNFAGADLRQANLEDTPLDGVLWSNTTQWPHGWEDRIRRSSVEISPGLYEIHGSSEADHAVSAPAPV